ncbi:MAG: chromosomal replication initiator protein DnaA, partial [Planctomycetota bacterium]|nr:chromosomal replication initiator protein DnaA [Planctomycetota bacterium]
MAPAERNLWQQVLHHLGAEAPVPPWLAQAHLSDLSDSHASLTLPEAHDPSQVNQAIRSALEQALEQTIGRHVELRVQPAEPPTEQPTAAPPKPASWPERFLAGEVPTLNPHHTFENFVTGPCNRMAHAAALAISDLPGQAYNPLFIHASVGLGKSHLMQAICHRLTDSRPDVSMMYLSCEDFVNQFIRAIEHGQVDEFRYRFRYLDVLIIDDIHFLTDKDRTQEEFFHTFNTLYRAQKQVVLSSDSPPHEIPRIEERLVSRFKWGLVARIDRPSYETRVAIVRKKARLRRGDLPEDVLQYIASAIDTNNRELEGGVVRVLGFAALSNREVTMDLAKEALRDLVHEPNRSITIQAITDAVLERFNARLSDLQSKRRTQTIAIPRQISMYLARR